MSSENESSDTLEGLKSYEENLKFILELGVSRSVAERALRDTNNSSIDLAASRALEIFDSCRGNDGSWDVDEYKMSFVVNSSLNMSPGKLAAQVAHGALSIYRQLMEDPQKTMELVSWQNAGETKIVLKGEDTSTLTSLAEQAKSQGLPYVLIEDAGRTEIPAGSTTVLALFGTVDAVNSVTSSLSLL